MNFELIIQLATLISVIVGIATLSFAIRSYQRQMNAQVFIEYTGRFEQIMQSFPHSAWAARLNLEKALPEPSDELSLCVLRYLNLCSEEYYLRRRGYLAKEVWGIWERELQRTLKCPLFVREWKKLVGEFESYEDFRRYVEKAQS